MSSDTVDWCNLPKNLLIMVAKRLDNSTDILRLRAVCSPWRSSLPRYLNNNSPFFIVKFPFSIDPNPACSGSGSGGHFTLTKRTIYYLEPCSSEDPYASASASSPQGWMVKVEEDKPGKKQLLHPLSNQELPIFKWLKVWNSLKFRVLEVRKIDLLQFVDSKGLESGVVKKVAMSSVPLLTDDDSDGGDCEILTIHNGGKLCYFKVGDSDWTMINDGQAKSHYDDILYHKGKFYAVEFNGRMIVFDTSLNVSAIESPVHRDNIRDGFYKYKSLVESNGELYLVDKYFEWYLDPSDSDDEFGESLTKFKVYKLNEEEKEWVQVTSLGDRAFFLCGDCCFSVLSKQFPGCKSNCIYFTDSSFARDEDDDRPSCDVGIFDFELGYSEPLFYFEGCSRIFWPPPTWLKKHKVSLKPSSSRR